MKVFSFVVFLILAIFPFGQLTRLPVGIPEVNVYLQDLVIAILVLSWFFYHFRAKKPFYKPLLTWPILSFFLVATLSLVVNLPRLQVREALIASLYLWRWIFYAGIYFIVCEISKYRNMEISRLKYGLVFAGTIAAILGLVQYFIYPDLSNLVYLDWDPHKYRIFGTFFDPGFLGIISVLTLILIVISYINMSYKLAWKKRILILAGILVYLVLALTYSRASYLAYLGGMGIIAWIKKVPKFFLAVLLLGVLTILVLPRPSGSEGVRLEREESAWGRIKNWGQAVTIVKDKPIFGVGFNTYRYAQRDYGFLGKENWQESHSGAGVDSSLFFVLATTGVLGLSVYLWLWKKILGIKDLAVLASIAALFVHSWFLNSLFYPWIMLWVWILAGSVKANN